MSYTRIEPSDYISSFWIMTNYPGDDFSEQFKLSGKIETSFSPSTDWEKVFEMGDVINRKLSLTEKDVADEVSSYRKSKK